MSGRGFTSSSNNPAKKRKTAKKGMVDRKKTTQSRWYNDGIADQEFPKSPQSTVESDDDDVLLDDAAPLPMGGEDIELSDSEESDEGPVPQAAGDVEYW